MDERFEIAQGTIGELFWNVPEAVMVCRPGRVLRWNPGAEAMFGVGAEEATAPGADLRPLFGEAWDDLCSLVEQGAGKARLDCTEANGKVLDAVVWHVAGDASRPVVVVLRDVTLEHRRAGGLRRLNALARELVAEASLDVLLVRIVDAAKDLAGADYSALLLLREASLEEVAHFVYNAPRELFPERLPRVVGMLSVPVRTGRVVRIDDIRGHPAGVGIPVEHPPIAALLAAPVLVGDLVVGELAVANRPGRPGFDEVHEAVITELAAHAAVAVSLTTARQFRDQLDATRQGLLDVALHNIRTPLTVAKGFLATLRSHWDDLSVEDREHAFEAMVRAHDRIERLAEGTLLDDPLGASGGPREVVEVGVVDVLDELRAAAGATLEATVEPGTPATFLADRRLVRELLDHLVDNAVKHSPPGAAVRVTGRGEGPSVRFDVSDRGPGIPPEEQGRVFEQFYRTRQAVEAGLPGNGLGLWIVRRLAGLQGGAVGLSSRTGQGTTVWVTFPAARSTDRVPGPTA